jgi:FMN phosphatase YigB (HAD superfamily)
MVGDRLDNDIEPAKVHGWQTWHLSASHTEDGQSAGGWDLLLRYQQDQQ